MYHSTSSRTRPARTSHCHVSRGWPRDLPALILLLADLDQRPRLDVALVRVQQVDREMRCTLSSQATW